MPSNQIDPDADEALWEIANEERENRSPAEWWDDELSYSVNAERLRAAYDRIIAKGCSPGELLPMMRQISTLANVPVMPRRDVEAHLRKARQLSDELDVLPITQVGPFLGDVSALQGELFRYVKRLDAFLKKSRRKPHPDLPEAVEEFTRYVHRHSAGKQHADVALLLHFVTTRKKTETAQRMATSRMNKKRPLRTKQTVQVKRAEARPDTGWLRQRPTAITHRGQALEYGELTIRSRIDGPLGDRSPKGRNTPKAQNKARR